MQLLYIEPAVSVPIFVVGSITPFWYDFEWYVRNNTPLDFRHLQERIREFNGNGELEFL